MRKPLSAYMGSCKNVFSSPFSPSMKKNLTIWNSLPGSIYSTSFYNFKKETFITILNEINDAELAANTKLITYTELTTQVASTVSLVDF